MPLSLDSLSIVLDDFVKIGLGAIIGAAGAIYVTLLNHRHATRSETKRRRSDLLKEVGTRFATLSSNHLARFNLESQIPFIPESEKLRMKSLRNLRDTYPSNDKLHAELDQTVMLAHMAAAPEVVDSMIAFITARDRLGSAVHEALKEKARMGVAPESHRQGIVIRMKVLNEANGNVVASLRDAYNRI